MPVSCHYHHPSPTTIATHTHTPSLPPPPHHHCTFTYTCTQAEGALPALVTIEMPLVPVLVTMENCGVAISREALRDQKPAMESRLRQLEAEAAAANGGVRFNLAAPGEVSKVVGCGCETLGTSTVGVGWSDG